MRDSKNLKPRSTIILVLGLSLLAFVVPHTPVISQNAGQPKVIASSAPNYPSIVAIIRAMGKVVVEVKIDAEGKVTSAKAKGGHPILYKASEEAAAGWQFESAQHGASERSTLLTFDFILDPSCNGAPVFRSPYHVEVRPVITLLTASDTESYIPPDFAGENCPVHGLALMKDKVEIRYGLIEFKSNYLKAEKKHFPFANTASYGGCIVEWEENPCDGKRVQRSPKFAEVLYCPKCRAAQQKWAKAHPWRRG
ncbi:MAG: energy transducer TonB [Rubrivivax sp.]|nr:energy transducer TonB [Pyrinomonadaceae bacterium]